MNLTIEKNETLSLAQFCANNKIKSISNVRQNTNGYPFTTMLWENDNKTEAENVYFSKKISDTLSEGDKPQTFKNFYVRLTENEAGESRIKICSNSEYTDINTLFN